MGISYWDVLLCFTETEIQFDHWGIATCREMGQLAANFLEGYT